MILRMLRLRSLTDVSTISGILSLIDNPSVDIVQGLSRSPVVERLQERFLCLTQDFSGTGLSTKGHAQGTIVGFNKIRKEILFGFKNPDIGYLFFIIPIESDLEALLNLS